MKKEVLSLMEKNFKQWGIDLDEMAKRDENKMIDFIHDQYMLHLHSHYQSESPQSLCSKDRLSSSI